MRAWGQTVISVLNGLTDAGAGADKGGRRAGRWRTACHGPKTGPAQLADGTRQLATSVDTATTPLIDFLARFDDKGDQRGSGRRGGRPAQSRCEDTTDRIRSANIDWVRGGRVRRSGGGDAAGQWRPEGPSGRRHSLRGAKVLRGAISIPPPTADSNI